MTTDLIIIGGGPAGLSAAIRAKEEGIKDLLVIERNPYLGGILNQCIHNGFGLHIFKEELTGPEYAQRLIDRAEALEVPFALNAMTLDITPDKLVTYASPEGIRRIQAKAIILAMGCRERPRGALGIPGGRGSGIYTAGTAQAMVNMKGYLPGKRAVILGSGDIGLIMARRMTLEGATVAGVFELMPHSGGLKRNIVQCLHDYGIPLHLSHTVTRIVGHDRVEGVHVAAVDAERKPRYDTERFIPCDTLLLSVGLIPENELSKKAGVSLSALTGGALVDSNLETNVPGIFSCGNVLHVHDLVDNVTLEAYEAASSAVRYIREERPDSRVISVKTGRGIRYTAPFYLRMPTNAKEAVDFSIMFRSDAIYRQATIQVHADGRLIKAQKKRVVTPGEMESLRFSLDAEAKEVTVTLEVDVHG